MLNEVEDPLGSAEEKHGLGLVSVMVDRYLGWIKTSVYPSVSD